jgi:hypothetical protein
LPALVPRLAVRRIIGFPLFGQSGGATILDRSYRGAGIG